MNTPVAFFIFKRPDTTEKVFEAIRQAKPSRLLVVADGPRPDRVGEADRCAASRAIIDRVDWDCEVLTNYSDTNLGCRHRLASGLDWVFNTVEEAIILEDDCLPHSSFFGFCEELLDRYRDDNRIFLISGQNVQKTRRTTGADYYFSRYTHCWGWASWRRAWQHYDVDMKLWPIFRDRQLLHATLADDPYALKVWNQIFQRMFDQPIDTWDYQLQFAAWTQSAMSILSSVKLVENIGFGVDGTHTTGTQNFYAEIPVRDVTLPLRHPPFVVRDRIADRFTQRTLYDYQSNLFKRFTSKAQRVSKHFLPSNWKLTTDSHESFTS